MLVDLESIGELKKLARLHVRQNKLKTLAGIDGAQSLAYINARDNQIEDFKDISMLSVLPYLRKLNLQGILMVGLRSFHTVQETQLRRRTTTAPKSCCCCRS